MVRLPDSSDMKIVNDKINWTQIHGAFLLLTPEEFGKGSYTFVAKVLGVSKTSFERHSKKINPDTGKNWWQERKEIQQEISTDVQKQLVKTQTEERIDLIKQSKKIKGLIAKKALVFLESEEFKVNDENLSKLLDIEQKYGMNIAKMAGVVDGGGGKGSYVFKINVPLNYITAEGRAWLLKKKENPVSILEGDFEDITDEEQIQRKQLAEDK